jgi:hypothetical protein
MPEYIDRAVAVSQANFIHGRWDDVYVSADGNTSCRCYSSNSQ